MALKSNTSTNIIRDTDKQLKYIPTPNAVAIYNQINLDFEQGKRAFNIVGSYGTGKSTFLWAYEQNLRGINRFFGVNIVPKANIDFIKLVGNYASLKNSLAEALSLKVDKDRPENIFSEIFNRYHDLGSGPKLLVLIIDEFGKFLEYAAENYPEKELYFIQQLAEFINNPEHNILLITTVHQNFDAYVMRLSTIQRHEWTKVKGRFKEITFNEPVEQLLYLAAEYLDERSISSGQTKNITLLNELLVTSKAFKVNYDYIYEVARKLYPLDILSAYVLTLSLQRYGQNERSLFSFLDATEETGIDKHIEAKKGFYNIADVHDYLVQNFYSVLNTRFNADFNAWQSIKASLETVEAVYDGKDINDYFKVIKVIGLLSLHSQSGADLGTEFLVKYCKVSLGIRNPGKIIEDLLSRKIIYYRNYNKKYILFEGTDLDIHGALYEAGNQLDEITDVVSLLKKNYSLAPVLAKQSMYTTGTPRLFEYVISSAPVTTMPEGEVDGFINLIFNENDIYDTIIETSAENSEAILYCYYRNSKEIKELLFEIEKTRKVIQENPDDRVAKRELENIKLHQKNLLNYKIIKNLYSTTSQVTWFFKGQEITILSQKDFNRSLSRICLETYSKTPYFNNELVNKHKISPSIHTAKRNYFKALINNWGTPNLGFPKDKFPPEKMIYLSLLENNGIQLFNNQSVDVVRPNDDNGFSALWDISVAFLESAVVSKRNISEFVELLLSKPFKLKQGFVDFWIPTFLFIKREEFALFGQSGYIPYISEEIVDLIAKKPKDYQIKSFALEGVKLDIFNSYRLILNNQSGTKIGNQSFIDTIKPFLVFYRGLNDYAKYTKRLSKQAIAIRHAIATSKDPEESFFEDFPLALGYTVSSIQKERSELQTYINGLQSAIKELRSCYDELIGRFEFFIEEKYFGKRVGFENYQKKFQLRFELLHRHLLTQEQKSFMMRLDSNIEDRDAWLNALAQTLTGKAMQKFKDEDEVILYDKFQQMIITLDSLSDISQIKFDESKEVVVDIQINSYESGMSKKLIRLPKGKKSETESLEKNIKLLLSKDKSIDIAALTAVLKDLL